MLFTEGIPIVYYGTEQGFDGGNDPDNRAPLWTTKFDEESELYKFVKQVVSIRKEYKVWGLDQTERWVEDNLYAFSRGDVFVATTNQVDEEVHIQVTFHPYSKGQKVCNQLYAGDCTTIS